MSMWLLNPNPLPWEGIMYIWWQCTLLGSLYLVIEMIWAAAQIFLESGVQLLKCFKLNCSNNSLSCIPMTYHYILTSIFLETGWDVGFAYEKLCMLGNLHYYESFHFNWINLNIHRQWFDFCRHLYALKSAKVMLNDQGFDQLQRLSEAN